jgi:hypothetical protein
MCGGVKLMLCTINSSEELIKGTVAHLDEVVQLLRNVGPGSKSCEQRRIAALQLVEVSKVRINTVYCDTARNEAHMDMLRTDLLNFFINCRVKVNCNHPEVAGVSIPANHYGTSVVEMFPSIPGPSHRADTGPGISLPERRNSG